VTWAQWGPEGSSVRREAQRANDVLAAKVSVLRYAIEKFSKAKREHYLGLKLKP
jgi:hypothetical protein